MCILQQAKVAGNISVEQFKLAMRLGDPQLVARCYLYAALSLLQQGFYRNTKKMVQKIFKFAVDNRLTRKTAIIFDIINISCK